MGKKKSTELIAITKKTQKITELEIRISKNDKTNPLLKIHC